MKKYFENFDPGTFWKDDNENPPKLTDEMVEEAEKELGYKLPGSYIELLKIKNGGYPVNTCFPTKEKTSWADDHIMVDTIWGIGTEESIDGPDGSRYMIQEWEYPETGIVICSWGHTAVMLDYSDCGTADEPKVVFIDTETRSGEPQVIFLAQDFETFIKGLVNEDKFND